MIALYLSRYFGTFSTVSTATTLPLPFPFDKLRGRSLHPSAGKYVNSASGEIAAQFFLDRPNAPNFGRYSGRIGREKISRQLRLAADVI